MSNRSFLGYADDLGVIGSILGMPIFVQYYYTDQGRSLSTYTFDKSWIVSFFVLGCFFGSFINGWMSDRIGRKWTIIVGAIVFTIGGAVQTAAINVPMLYIGRMIAGLAVGGLSVCVLKSVLAEYNFTHFTHASCFIH